MVDKCLRSLLTLRLPVSAFLLTIASTGQLFGQNLIQLENQKPGTDAWKITNAATNHEIEGYASLTSVNRGNSLTLYVNTTEATYNLSIYRVGWYNGAGGRLVADYGTLTGKVQPACPQDATTGMIECNWTASATVTVPTTASDWTSGIYLAKLTGKTSGKQRYIIFAVRDDGRTSTYLFQSSVTTFQAYNGWGGRSLYGYNSFPSPARKVSFNRPYADGLGSGDFSTQWEINMLRFLEHEGYDVAYCTDIDTHRDASLILQHRGFLVVGHDEYWTWQMRNNVEAARGMGVNLGFFSPNAGYWQIRLDPSVVTGAVHRTVVGYKGFAPTEDPYYNDPTNKYLSTVRFRDTPVNRPESTLIGIMYDEYDDLSIDVDMVISDASSWVCAGTGLTNGATIHGMVGYEADHAYVTSPANLAIIAHSPVHNVGYADVATYTQGTATVFATGTMQWSWGLDDTDYGGHGRLSFAIQQMTRNVLARFAGTAVPTPTGLVTAVGPLGTFDGTYSDYVGMQIKMGPVAQTLTQLGFWCQPGDLGSHLVKMASGNGGGIDLFPPVSVTCNGVSGFHYVSAPAGISLAANTNYYLLTSGPPFYDATPVLASTAASIPGAVSLSGGVFYPESVPNVTYGPLDIKFTASTPPPPTTSNLISGVGSLGTVNKNYNDYAGMQILMGPTSQTLTQLGVWCQAKDKSTHSIKVTSDTAGHPDVVAALNVTCDTVEGFHYVNTPAGVVLAANTIYYLLAKGTPFYERSALSPSSVASIPRAVSVSDTTYWLESTPNAGYGPLDMKVTTSAPPPPKTLVSSVGDLGSVNSTYRDFAGMQFKLTSSQSLAQVGFWCESGDHGTHLVKVTTDAPSHPDLFPAAPVTCNGNVGFQYVNAPANVVLAGQTFYYLLASGTPFYNRSAIVPTSIGTIPKAVSVWETTYYPETTPNASYGPLDLRFN